MLPGTVFTSLTKSFLSSLKRKSTRTTPDISRSSYILFVIPFTLSRISSGIFAGISLFPPPFFPPEYLSSKDKKSCQDTGLSTSETYMFRPSEYAAQLSSLKFSSAFSTMIFSSNFAATSIAALSSSSVLAFFMPILLPSPDGFTISGYSKKVET